MKAESVLDIIEALSLDEQEKLFKLIKKPLRSLNSGDWIYSRIGLSKYLGINDLKPSTRTLMRWENAGLINSYKLGKTVFYNRSEIDKSFKKVER